MPDAKGYVKIVGWSDEDQRFVGSCPGLFYGGCHGSDEKQVFAGLCEIVEETIVHYKQNGTPLPPRLREGTTPIGCLMWPIGKTMHALGR